MTAKNKQRTLASASETAHREHAISVYAEHIEQLVKVGGNQSYEDAAALIARIGACTTPPSIRPTSPS